MGTRKKLSVDLDECILCQKMIWSEYLSSGKTGRGHIVVLAKEDEGSDNQTDRVLSLTAQKQELFKYHSSSCYRRFQRDMEKKRKNPSL